MQLQKTYDFLEEKRTSKDIGSYAVLLFDGKTRRVVTSPDVNEETYFDIASMGKVLVTSTLVLQGIEEGLISLDDNIVEYFPFAGEDKKNITVEQLLLHTSGVLRDENQVTKEIVALGKDAIAESILSAELGFAPGERFTYSCAGYILLGFIVEKAFGKPLDTLFYERIHAPLGLVRSDFNIPVDCDNAVCSYTRKEVGSCRADDRLVYNMHGVAGNGASFWCLRDIETFIRAILDYKLFSKELSAAAERNRTPHLEEGRGLGYLVIDEDYMQAGNLFPVGSFGHAGHTGTCFFIHRESGVYAIVLTNATRCLKIKSDWGKYDYNVIKELRRDIHNALLEDM